MNTTMMFTVSRFIPCAFEGIVKPRLAMEYDKILTPKVHSTILECCGVFFEYTNGLRSVYEAEVRKIWRINIKFWSQGRQSYYDALFAPKCHARNCGLTATPPLSVWQKRLLIQKTSFGWGCLLMLCKIRTFRMKSICTIFVLGQPSQ